MNYSRGNFWKSINQPLPSALTAGLIVALLTNIVTLPFWFGALLALFIGLWCYFHLLLSHSDPALEKRERAAYLAFRRRIGSGGFPAEFYDRGITALLAWSERFFGDVGQDKPCWSAASYDRCLLLAVVYPVITIFLLWVFNGGAVGLAETALGFEHNVSDWRRGLALLSLLPLAGVIIWIKMAIETNLSWRHFVLVLGAYVVALVVAGASVVIPAGAAMVAGATASAGVVALVFTLVIALVFVLAFVDAGAGAVAGAVAGVVAVAVYPTAKIVERTRFYKIYLSLFTLIVLVGLIFGLPGLIIFSQEGWEKIASLALFLPLLAIVNAPFDWFSLGVTRRLLRAGLKRRGWWAILFSLADLVVALLCMVTLAFAMILAVQAFNASLVWNGGAAVYDLHAVMADLSDSDRRWQPEYFWIYCTIFSTFIPSLLNMIIGSQAIWRGLLPFNRWAASKLPLRVSISRVDMIRLPPFLAFQNLAVIGLAVAALWAFIYTLMFWLLPLFGAVTLEMLADIVQRDYPAQWMGI